MKGLTKRQREIVDYIDQFINANRYSPSYREICRHFGFTSVASASKHILALKRKGALINESGASRSMALSEQAPIQQDLQGVVIPFIGTISAGIPIQIFSQTQQVTVPKTLAHSPEKTYALRVQGHSLNEEMIADGDLLMIEARQNAYPGETVIALINGHDTIIKKYFPEGDSVRLLGTHSQHHPMILHHDDVQIQGVLIGLLRYSG